MIAMLLVALAGAAYAAGFIHGYHVDDWRVPDEEAAE